MAESKHAINFHFQCGFIFRSVELSFQHWWLQLKWTRDAHDEFQSSFCSELFSHRLFHSFSLSLALFNANLFKMNANFHSSQKLNILLRKMCILHDDWRWDKKKASKMKLMEIGKCQNAIMNEETFCTYLNNLIKSLFLGLSLMTQENCNQVNCTVWYCLTQFVFEEEIKKKDFERKLWQIYINREKWHQLTYCCHKFLAAVCVNQISS